MADPASTSTAAPAGFLSLAGTRDYVDDPYPHLAELRAHDPVLDCGNGIWVVSRYADVAAGVRDQRLSCDFASLDHYAAYFRARGIDDRFPLPLNALDPPDHRRIRSAIGKEFMPPRVEELRPLVADTVERVVGDLAASGRPVIDLVSDVAFPVPVAIIGRLFGIPEADEPLLRRWSEAFGAVSDPDVLLTDEQRRAAAEATQEAGEYFGRMLLDRRRAPGDDLMSRWVADTLRDGVMSVAELLVNGVFLLIVGHHNTVSLVANGMHALLEHPGELARLRADPGLLGGAVEELLRFDSPVQTSTRVTVEPYEIGGVEIPARQQVMLHLGSANRDPEVFADPDRLDITRAEAGRNLGFGRGIHACVGGQLARVEAGAAIAGLLRHFPHLEAAGPVERRVPCFTLRGMTRFPVRVAPGEA